MSLEQTLVLAVSAAIDLATSPLRARLSALEGRLQEKAAPTTAEVGVTDLVIRQSDDFRTVTFCKADGTEIGAISFPVVLDAGVYDEKRAYPRGSLVTRDGGLWIAQGDAAPGDDPRRSSGWRLAVRKGQDGRRGDPGPAGTNGAAGTPGRPAVHPITGAGW